MSTFGLAMVLGIIALDQAAKFLAEAYLPFGRAIDVMPLLALYRTYNEGIAFSMLAGAGSPVLLVVTGAISIAVIILWSRAKDAGLWGSLGYALIVGGALGNLIDRFAYGHVVDYLMLHYGDWTLFVFNLADAALTLGPLALIVGIFLSPKEP